MPQSFRSLPTSLSSAYLCLGLGLLVLSSQCLPLSSNSLLSPLAGGLGLCTLGVHLVLEDLLALFLSLGSVDLWCVSMLILQSSSDIKHTCSTRARLCLNVLPLLRWYSSWYRCLSILPAARYLTSRRRRTRRRLIHRTWLFPLVSILCYAQDQLLLTLAFSHH